MTTPDETSPVTSDAAEPADPPEPAGTTEPAETAEAAFLSVDGDDLHVRQDGPRDAPALLLVHGSAASTRSWDALVPLLTGSRRVIRVDLLGFGRSAKPADGDYGIPAQGRRAGAVLDRLGVARALVVAHSSGGLVATALAEQRPALVSGLTLINTGPHLAAFLGGAESTAVAPERWPPDEALVRRMADTAFSRAGFDVPQDVVDDVRGMTHHGFTATLRAASDYLARRPLPLARRPLPERLAPLGVPLQVIFGDRDRRWRPASAADYRAVPGARIDWLPGIGHSPPLEDPAGTAAPLLAFAARHAARAD